MLLSVVVNCPDAATADRIAEALLERRLIACANRYAEVTSVYEWNGAAARATETPLLVKTVAERFDSLVEVVRSLHPFETPAIFAQEIVRAAPDYARWITEQTREDQNY